MSILGQVVRELKDIANETPDTLEQILTLRRNGVSDRDVGEKNCGVCTKHKYEIE